MFLSCVWLKQIIKMLTVFVGTIKDISELEGIGSVFGDSAFEFLVFTASSVSFRLSFHMLFLYTLKKATKIDSNMTKSTWVLVKRVWKPIHVCLRTDSGCIGTDQLCKQAHKLATAHCAMATRKGSVYDFNSEILQDATRYDNDSSKVFCFRIYRRDTQ